MVTVGLVVDTGSMNKAYAYQLDRTCTDCKVLLYKALPCMEVVPMVEVVDEEEEEEEEEEA